MAIFGNGELMARQPRRENSVCLVCKGAGELSVRLHHTLGTGRGTTSMGGNPMRRHLFRTTGRRGRLRVARGGKRGGSEVGYNFGGGGSH